MGRANSLPEVSDRTPLLVRSPLPIEGDTLRVPELRLSSVTKPQPHYGSVAAEGLPKVSVVSESPSTS